MHKLISAIILIGFLISGIFRSLYKTMDDDGKLFSDIYYNCSTLDTTYFLDYLSSVDYNGLDQNYYLLVCAMRDFNIAIDPLFRGAPMQAIKNLNKMNDNYRSEIISKYIPIDANVLIKTIEYELMLKNDYHKSNKLYFGRLNNSTPITFQLIDKIGNDYLLLQDGVFDLALKCEEVYQDGKCLLKDNEIIKRSFKLENDIIKDIYIFSESDFQKYKRVKKGVRKYLDVELNKKTIRPDESINNAMSENCEKERNGTSGESHTSYWVKDDVENITKKFYRNGKMVDSTIDDQHGVRLAILVQGDYHEK
ncbi:MAG: hypothetical protein J6M39_08310 [Lachnospiraceae bacterium]|nr:hypothetical protein [Lachnospiraceae bacterium]